MLPLELARFYSHCFVLHIHVYVFMNRCVSILCACSPSHQVYQTILFQVDFLGQYFYNFTKAHDYTYQDFENFSGAE